MFRNLSTEALGISGQDSEIIELLLSSNFKGIDLDLTEFSARVQTQGLAKARRLLDSARLKFGSFRLPLDWHGNPDEFKKALTAFTPLAELAKELGCTRAITAIEVGSDLRPYHENFETHRRRFTEIAEKLAPYGIKLGIEVLAPIKLRAGYNCQFIQTVDQALMLLNLIQSPNVGLALDVWHWHLGGGTVEQLKPVASRVVTVSLADAPPTATAATADDSQRLLPGENGVIDSAAFLKVLSEAKYDGPVTPKPSAKQFTGQSRDKIVKQAGVALDKVWQDAGIVTPGRRPSVVGR